MEKKVGHWTCRWLFLGGRLVLVKLVLQNMSVYWLSLAKVPAKIIQKISQTFSRFLWKGAKKPTSFHLVSLDKITKPKALGGWGIRNLKCFAQPLAAKSLWQGLFGFDLWSKVLEIFF